MFLISEKKTPEKITILPKYVNDPIFKGLPNPFQAVEDHSWDISPLFLKDDRYKEFQLIAENSHIQSLKSSMRPMYSEQFHSAVVNDYNQSGPYIANFLKLAKEYHQASNLDN